MLLLLLSHCFNLSFPFSSFLSGAAAAGFASAAEYAATNAEAKGKEVALQLFKQQQEAGRRPTTTIVVGSDTV
jgi:hypothetical protein